VIRRRALLVLAAAVCSILAWAAWDPAVAAAAGDDLDTRIFSIRFKSVEDVVLLIEPYVGERGSYMVQPKLKTITIRDEPARLDRIAGVISAFDQPPRSVRVVVQLLDAAEAPSASAPKGEAGTGVRSLLRDVTKWSEVSVIGSASIVGVEGANSVLNIGDSYRIRFSVDAVAERQGVVKFNRFALDRIVHGKDGEVRYAPLLDTVLNLHDNQQLVIGATKSQDSRRALFLSLTATLEPSGPVAPQGQR
jgi:hypothetical protein